MQATHGSTPADALMALLPTTPPRREVLTLATQMRHSAHILSEYPVAAAQVRAHLLSFCEHQFRQSAGLGPTANLNGISGMAAVRLQVVFDGLTTTLLEDTTVTGAPDFTLIRGLLLRALPPGRS